MEQMCRGIVLAQKELRKGHSSLKFLSAEMGKFDVSFYFFSVEKKSKNLPIPTGACIETLVRSIPKYQDRYYLSDVKIQHTISGTEKGLKSMGFVMFLLEILDLLILNGDLFPYYSELLEHIFLFDKTENSSYILFFLTYFLISEGWWEDVYELKMTDNLKSFVVYAKSYLICPEAKFLVEQEKYQLSCLLASIVKKIRNRSPHSIELLRF